jgi:hypothetical protein
MAADSPKMKIRQTPGGFAFEKLKALGQRASSGAKNLRLKFSFGTTTGRPLQRIVWKKEVE